MTIAHIALLIGVGFLAGGVNAIVGGGTFFSFPVLLSIGLPPVTANATSTVALWPASLTAARAYIPELRRAKATLFSRVLLAIAGSTVGAFLLLASGDALFGQLVPWLLGGATFLFAFSKPIVARVAKLGQRRHAFLMTVLELAFAVYGGYFGAGVGILLMAALALGGETDPQAANAQKNLLAASMNGAAVVIFIVRRAVIWPVALTVMVGAVAGGYMGARLARRIPAPWLRGCVIAVGFTLSAIYFRNAYFL